jgi:hypothetical protein
LHVDIRQAFYQRFHDRRVIVYASQEHALIANRHASGVQPARCLLSDPGDLIGVRDMRMQRCLFPHVAGALRDVYKRLHPCVVSEELGRLHAHGFGRKAHAPDVRNVEQRLADVRDLVCAQVMHVATANHHVLDLRLRAQVLERQLPTLGLGAQVVLGDAIRVDPDRVRARAEAAVHWAQVEREKQRFVWIAVHETGHLLVVLLVQRVEPHERMVGQLLGAERQELLA